MFHGRSLCVPWHTSAPCWAQDLPSICIRYYDIARKLRALWYVKKPCFVRVNKILVAWDGDRWNAQKQRDLRSTIFQSCTKSTQTMCVWKSIGLHVAGPIYFLYSILSDDHSSFILGSVYLVLTMSHYAAGAFSIWDPGLWCKNKRSGYCLSTANVRTTCVCVPFGILQQYNYHLFHWCLRWIWDARYFLH